MPVSDVILLALGTLLGYFVAFNYQSAYAEFFGIPPGLIGFDPGSLLMAASGIWSFVLTIAIVVGVNYWVLGQPRSAFQRKFRRIAIPLILTAFLLALYQRGIVRVMTLVALALVVYYEFVRPIFQFPHVKGYLQKLAADEAEWAKPDTGAGRPFLIPIFVIVVALTLIGLGGAAGRFTAANTTRFLVLDDNPDFIVPKLDADNLIAVRIDRKAKKILPEVVVITREQGQPLRLRWEHIGMLTPSGR